MAREKRPLAALATRGLMHHRHTVGLVIPCQVASPQSLTPFRQASSRVTQLDRSSTTLHRTPEPCLENPLQMVENTPKSPTRFAEEPSSIISRRGPPRRSVWWPR